MRIGIIGGTGKEGAGLAGRWAQGGHDVTIGSRDAERARAKAAELSGPAGRAIGGMSNRDAAAAVDVVVLTLPASGLADTLVPLQDACRGKVVISAVVPLSFGGGRLFTPPVQGSSTTSPPTSSRPPVTTSSATSCFAEEMRRRRRW